MITARLVSETVPFIVRVLRRTASPREPESDLRQHRNGIRINRVAWIRERRRRRNSVSSALGINRLDLLLDLRQVRLRQPHVIPGVVANLESIAMQFRDLLPREVLLLVRRKGEALGKEDGCAEPVLLQQRPNGAVVTGLGVVD